MGIIGMSDGNGHPYSWSAIFNGYNKRHMKKCPFPVIPEYLSKQKFPEDGLGELGTVTHVWCQDKKSAAHIASSSNIPFVLNDLKEMIGKVDAVLLARDDARMHYEMALPFLKSGIPIFIDKPLAIRKSDAEKIWAAQQFDNQVFSCSSLRYAKELFLTKKEIKDIGVIKIVEGSVMKTWECYAIHILEPLIAQLPNRGQLLQVKNITSETSKQVLVKWENITGHFKCAGNIPCPTEIKFYGENRNITKTFINSFNAFKNSLTAFVQVVNNPEKNISKKITLELVTILERGII